MKAAQIEQYGGPEVLQIHDAQKPMAGKGEILVQVSAAAVNPFDIKVREGLVQAMAQLHFPATLGGDFAGIVAEPGEGTAGFEIGQPVYGQAGALSGQGSFAEFTPVKANSLALKPHNLDPTAAAAVPLVACSAYQALIDTMKLQAGQKILIHGGAGGIGSCAIQLAKSLGAYVATTASADDTEFVRQLGADEVIDYKTQDFSTILHDYDAVFDTVGGEANRKSYGILKPGAAFVSMVEQADESQAAAQNITYTSQFSRVTTERLDKVTQLIEAGRLTVPVDKIFPLDQAADALEYQKTGHPKGKIVIKIQN